MMSSCYCAPFQDDVRWVHSIPHARSLPSLRYVEFIVKSQTITLPDTCQHAGTQESFTSKTAYSALSSADFTLLWACLEGMNGVERRRQAQSQTVPFRVELGSSPEDILHSWSPGLQKGCSESPAPRQVAREQVLQSLCVSLAAVKEAKPLWNAQSSSQGTASSL